MYRPSARNETLLFFRNYFHSFFMWTKTKVLVKNFRISYEQSLACCLTEHKSKVSRLAISKIMTEHQNRACRLVQLSHFNLSFLMTTSHLFAYYTLDIQVSLSFSMIIKTGLFFFLGFCWIITPISGIMYKSFLCYGQFVKNREK